MFFYVAASFSLYCGSSKLGLFYMMLNLGIGKFTQLFDLSHVTHDET